MTAGVQPVQPVTPEMAKRAVSGPSALVLLGYEAEIRAQATPQELLYHLANETRKLVSYGQLFVFRLAGVPEAMQVQAVSSLATVERNAPLIRWLERSVARLNADAGLDDVKSFTAAAYADADDPELEEFPFAALMWTPFRDREAKVYGGALYARGPNWGEQERTLADRLAGTYGHAWLAFDAKAGKRKAPKLTKRQKRIIGVSLLVAALFPVRLSVVAPVEVVPARPFVMAAPVDGVVERIHVAPNARVAEGDLLASMDGTALRNELALAAERKQVAQARYERAASAAFLDRTEAREIAIAEAEFALAEAEETYAREQLALTDLRAPKAGIAVYSDRRDLEGRGMQVGERIMTVADPARVEYSVELPPADLIDLDAGAPVSVYLDSAPLRSVDAALARMAYQTSKTSDGRDVFRLYVVPAEGEAAQRIGARGSARVFGSWVPLVYRILRRPFAAGRQAIGL